MALFKYNNILYFRLNMPFVADIDAHGGHVVMYLYRQTPLCSSPDPKLPGRYKYRKVQLQLPKDGLDNINVSSGDLESSADNDALDSEEKTHTFDSFRQRAEFAYKEIRKTSDEAEIAIDEHEAFSTQAKSKYGPKWSLIKEKVAEEKRLSKRGAMAGGRLQRRFSKLAKVIPKARRVLDFDREDGGERVPTHSWAQLTKHELKRIFPDINDSRINYMRGNSQ